MTTIIDNLRRLVRSYGKHPRYITIPAALLAAILFLAGFRACTNPAAPPPPPPAPFPAGNYAASPPTSTDHGSTVADPALDVPALVIKPPTGIKPGFVERTISRLDQFDRWVPVETTTLPAQSFRFTIPAATDTERTTFSGYFESQSGTVPASLFVAGGAAGVAAKIDGWQVGKDVVRYGDFRAPEQQRAALTLPTGWHRAEIIVDRGGSFGEGGKDVEVSLEIKGAGEPWSVPIEPVEDAGADDEREAADSAVPVGELATEPEDVDNPNEPGEDTESTDDEGGTA